ncbi:MAG: SufD family Fe-S cluster assembly protein [Bacteroidales bacterium]|nr:SufD family Fe-S cluster assembly protein [Bacteroidales bacterium]MBR7034487.1 SufD family Fe-S cluster assembly protein [Bacteroidales bacterium]
MGNIVNPRVQELISECFPKELSFDALYVFSDGKINGSGNSIVLEGKKRVCLCFLDMRSFSYVVHVAKTADITLYTCYENESSSDVHISCDENSVCEQMVLQMESSKQNIFVCQGRNSTYRGGYFQLSGKQDTIRLFIDKDGENANTDLFGVFFPVSNNEYSIETRVNHNSPLCETEELFRGIADDSASGTFSGLVYVAKGAQKTTARQQNRNILLSNNARIHSEPQLEIYADDVVCNHGSSTGQIDDEALWYMQSRGINKTMAMRLLVAGFAGDVLQKVIDENLRSKIEEKIVWTLNEDRK